MEKSGGGDEGHVRYRYTRRINFRINKPCVHVYYTKVKRKKFNAAEEKRKWAGGGPIRRFFHPFLWCFSRRCYDFVVMAWAWQRTQLRQNGFKFCRPWTRDANTSCEIYIIVSLVSSYTLDIDGLCVFESYGVVVLYIDFSLVNFAALVDALLRVVDLKIELGE